MKASRSLRLMLLALAVSFVPASSFAGVFISVNFAPPILPVYEQPPCPDEGLMWVPGYWAYGDDGYYWVPGTWLPAPYEGALWTPPYWGWEGGFYIFHPGYWGRHVGYYGGVNYGFGYMGIGFVGGMWRGHNFEYNRAVMRVDERRIHNTYEDRNIVEHNTIRNDRRVAFSGGRDGIHHDPRPEERIADRDQHVRETSFQQSHVTAARSDQSLYVKNNGGHPSSGAVQRPFGNAPRGAQGFDRNDSPRPRNPGAGVNQRRGTYTPPAGNNGGNRNFENPRSNNGNPGGGFNGNPRNNSPQPDNRNFNPPPNNNGGRFNNPRNTNPQPDNRNFDNPRGNSGNPQPQPQKAPDFRQAPQPRPAPQVQPHPAPEFRQMPQQRPVPQEQSRPAPQPHSNPAPQQHGQGQNNGDHKDHQH
jgi:hypothetical protein